MTWDVDSYSGDFKSVYDSVFPSASVTDYYKDLWQFHLQSEASDSSSSSTQMLEEWEKFIKGEDVFGYQNLGALWVTSLQNTNLNEVFEESSDSLQVVYDTISELQDMLTKLSAEAVTYSKISKNLSDRSQAYVDANQNLLHDFPGHKSAWEGRYAAIQVINANREIVGNDMKEEAQAISNSTQARDQQVSEIEKILGQFDSVLNSIFVV